MRDFAGTSGAGDDQTAVVVSLAPAAAGEPAPEQFALHWRADGLGLLRQRVAGAAQALGPDAADGLVLAAFEVATNIVRHVPQPFPDATLTCRIVPADGRVTVELWHLGSPFQPPAEPRPDFSGASEGGFGLYIIDHTVAKVAYDSPIANVCRTTLVQTAAEDRRLGRSPLHALGGRTRQSTP